MTSRQSQFVIFFASLVIFAFGIPQNFLTVYDARFGMFANNMFAHGLSIFNWSYGAPYPDYTSGVTILSVISAWLFGKLSTFAITLPNAVVSSLTLVLIYKIAAKTSESWGYLAVIFALLSSTFFTGAYSLGPDQYVALLAAALFYLLYNAALEERSANILLISIVLILGFVFRGPIGLVILSGVAVSFYLVWGDYKGFITFSILSSLLLITLTAALLLTAYLEDGKYFYHRVVEMEVGSRFYNYSGYHSIWKYLKNVFVREAIAAPLALLVGVYLALTARTKLLMSLFVWFAVIVIGIAIPHGREARYIIPITPAIALLAAYPFAATDTHNQFFKYYRIAVAAFMRLLPLGSLGVVIGFMVYGFKHTLSWDLNYYVLIPSLLVLTACSFFKISQHRLSLIVGLLAYIIVMLFVVGPITESGESLGAFSQKVESLHKPIYFYDIGPDSTDLTILASMKHPLSIKPKFINNVNQLTQATGGVIIMRLSSFNDLPETSRLHLNIVIPAKSQNHKSLLAAEWS